MPMSRMFFCWNCRKVMQPWSISRSRARDWFYQSGFGRAQWYQAWLSEVLGEFCPDLRAAIAIFVGDGALANPRVPVFSFQKPMGNCSLLLPDIDLLRFRFAVPQDDLSYTDKQCRAVFAGATSGGFVSPEGIRQDGAIPRIRAALFFVISPMFRSSFRPLSNTMTVQR